MYYFSSPTCESGYFYCLWLEVPYKKNHDKLDKKNPTRVSIFTLGAYTENVSNEKVIGKLLTGYPNRSNPKVILTLVN